MTDTPAKLTLALPLGGSGILKIGSVSKPFHFDPPYAVSFYENIGRLVLLWGRFEQALEQHLSVVINIATQFGTEERMQVSFLRKMDLLRRLYRRCQPLSEHAEGMAALTKEAEQVSEDRNLIIHSNWGGFVDDDPPRLKLHNITHKGGVITNRTLEPTLKDIADLVAAIDHLLSGLLPFMFQAAPYQPGFAQLGEAPPQDQSEGDAKPPKPK
jgi:hypothetical protein